MEIESFFLSFESFFLLFESFFLLLHLKIDRTISPKTKLNQGKAKC
jgi:hypothetical protein